tara:strand:+ start:214 stop:663 length:450 start_codon:yes stop_codon:yes gene_type:complete
MANDVSFKIKGLDALIKRLGKLPIQIEKEVANEVNASALNIQSKAKKSVAANSTDKGRLLGSIQLVSVFKDKKLVYTVGSALKYAPYVEFGTGGTVNVPAGYEDFAYQFKGKGIRKINLRPRPYLIPAFESEIPILRKNIQNVIKNVKS